MEIKTKYNIGDTVYYIRGRGIIYGGDSFAVSPDTIESGKITSIEIEENKIVKKKMKTYAVMFYTILTIDNLKKMILQLI